MCLCGFNRVVFTTYKNISAAFFQNDYLTCFSELLIHIVLVVVVDQSNTCFTIL
jgi:hypothetical protein